MQNHHAFLFYANSLDASSVPLVYKTPSVDVTHIITDVLSIDEVRKLIAEAGRTPFVCDYRVCVVAVREIAHEAQHALLKVLEEPPAHALFYFVLGKTAVLLPTLLSRFSTESVDGSTLEETEVFESFLKASLAERLILITEKTKEKDTVWVESVMYGFEQKAVALKKKITYASCSCCAHCP
jgi:hypothetical protein